MDSDNKRPGETTLSALEIPRLASGSSGSRLLRSVSTPMARQVLGGGITHSKSRPIQTPPQTHPEEERWTLFGQLMSPEQPGVLKRSLSSQQQHDPAHSASSSPRSAPSAEHPGGYDYPEIPDVPHSPVPMDAPEYFTPRQRVTRRAYFDPDQSDESEVGSLSSTSSDEEVEKLTLPVPPVSTTANSAPHSFFRIPKLPQVPILYRNILKCAIAYLVASLFTFNPTLSMLINHLTPWTDNVSHNPSPSAHLVATIAVYFNPAKTLGGMVEADLFCFAGLFYSVLISVISMFMFNAVESMENIPSHSEVAIDFAHIGIIVWIGFTMSLVAFMKGWMNRPSFNTACSMTLIVLFVVLIREPSPSKLANTCILVIIGALISNVVNRLIWPTSATTNLHTAMIKALDSFKVLLNILTQSFLLEGELDNLHRRMVSTQTLQKAVDTHQNSFTALKKNLDEAKSEWLVTAGGGTPVDNTLVSTSPHASLPNDFSRRHPSHILEDTETSIWERFRARRKDIELRSSRTAYEDAVDSLNRLAQHLNGLRSGNRLFAQWLEGRQNESGTSDRDELIELVDELGPPLTSLSNTCTNSLKVLKEALIQSQPFSNLKHRLSAIRHYTHTGPSETEASDQNAEATFEDLVSELYKSLLRFDSTSNHALLRQYRRSENMRRLPTDSEVSHLPGEDMFVVYFFIFTLQEFGRDLVSLIDAVGRICANEQARRANGSIWRIFIHWPSRLLTKARETFARFFAFFLEHVLGHNTSVRSTNGTPTMESTSPSTGEPAGSFRRRVSRRLTNSFVMSRSKKSTLPTPFFPKVRPHAPNTISTAYDDLPMIGKIKFQLWIIGETLRSRNVKHAFKVGMGTAILSAPAFFEATRKWYLEWYGQWSLISYFIVISPTIGATNYLSVHRIAGTVAGAAVAAGIYTLFPGQPVILAIFGFLFSLPCFYIIVAKPQYVTTGRFVLLTYNLTCLYCYNVRDRELDPVFIATRRSLAVAAGVIWAAIVSRLWWPAEARRELGTSLSEFCLNLGWLYTRLVASNSYAPEYRNEVGDDIDSPAEDPLNERTPLIRKPKPSTAIKQSKEWNSVEEFMAMELHLQLKLIELQGLLAQTVHEPRLKGPFPVTVYRKMLTSLQTILDRLHSMRCVTTKEEWYTTVRQHMIIPVNKERREMVGNIILAFSVLSSSLRTKAPLPPYLPPAEESRLALIQAIQRQILTNPTAITGSRQLLFYAYVLTMKGVTTELEQLGRTMQSIFGVIGGSADRFEELFVTELGRPLSRGE